MDKIRINLYDLLICISKAQELVSPKLSNHQERVAYLSLRLAEEIKLSLEQQKDVLLAAIVHDIGALSKKERLEIIEAEAPNINSHAMKGAKLLKDFKPLMKASNIIKYHHIPWSNGEGIRYVGQKVPFASHIIHLADDVCVNIKPSSNIITQLPALLDNINKRVDKEYEPNLVSALLELGKKEYIWLDLVSYDPLKEVTDIGLFDICPLEIDDVIDLAAIFSKIIDFRSKFTARHSAGVAKTAERLAQLIGFSINECKMMLIAGYLHDLGKLAIDNEILEKPAKLDEDEFNEIRAHTYFTYRLLEEIPQLKTINMWASFHHEKLNGKGYPFRLNGDNLPLGSLIMAVADVFTAITENRPYRLGMSDDSAMNILNNMVINAALDSKVVDVLIENFQEINDIRKLAQQEASEQYEKFVGGGVLAVST